MSIDPVRLPETTSHEQLDASEVFDAESSASHEQLGDAAEVFDFAVHGRPLDDNYVKIPAAASTTTPAASTTPGPPRAPQDARVNTTVRIAQEKLGEAPARKILASTRTYEEQLLAIRTEMDSATDDGEKQVLSVRVFLQSYSPLSEIFGRCRRTARTGRRDRRCLAAMPAIPPRVWSAEGESQVPMRPSGNHRYP